METQKLSNHNTNSNRRFQYNPGSLTNGSNAADVYEFDSVNGSKAHRARGKPSGMSNLFGDVINGDDKTTEATEMTKLRPRGSGANLQTYTMESSRSAPPDNVVYLEREILPTDTLQSFALLYGCTLNDIKRANSLITEQDFFTLRRIKIPVKRHGLLTEPEEEHKRRPIATTSLTSSLLSSSSSQAGHQEALVDDDFSHKAEASNDVYHNPIDELESGDSFENLSLLGATSPGLNRDVAVDRNDTSKFLKKMDKEIRQTLRKNNNLDSERNEILEEVVSSIGSVGYRPLPLPGNRPPMDECNGSDWGVKWWILLIFFVVVLFVILVIGVEFYLKYHHQQVLSNGSTVSPTG